MAPASPSPAERAAALDAEVIRLQSEANERLLLALLHATDEAAALTAQSTELSVLGRSRERLIGIIGHDLRTPLNTIALSAGLLVARGNLSLEDSQLAKRIVKSGRRMARLTEQLVDFTRARQAGGFRIDTGEANIGTICAEVVDELRTTSATAMHQTAIGNLQGGWDEPKLEQALSNIVANALEYAAPGTAVFINAYEAAAQEGPLLGPPDVVVAVSNTGPAIPDEMLPVLFDAFHHHDGAPKRNTAHLGLGLFIAAEIVKAHGGALSAGSSEGTTTFTMRLPRVVPPAEATPRPPTPSSPLQ